jgi:hypothetical protein
MARVLLLFALISGDTRVYSGEILNTQAFHTNSDFEIISSMLIQGDSRAVFKVLTDYEKLAEISDIVLDTAKVTKNLSLKEGPIRVRINTRTCVLMFCFKARIVEDVEVTGDMTIKADIVPELSDFKADQIIIQVQDYPEGKTHVKFESRFTPDFWISPIIGPMIVKHKAIKTTTNTIFQIEKLINDE